MIKTDKIVKNLYKNLSERQKEFLEERFGLKDGKRKTLQELGERYGITRERVRQIETEALKTAHENFKKSDGHEVVKITQNHLEVLGGVRKEDSLIADLKYLLKDNSLAGAQLKFLFEVSKNPHYYGEDEKFFGFWYLNKSDLKKLNEFVKKAVKFFASKREQLISKDGADKEIAQLAGSAGFSDFTASNFIAVSKEFGINPFNDFGLSHWEEINPKTARSKAYLVLKKQGKPLHFRDIASHINKVGFDNKKVYAQTIHNELIKDSRFVLVGRGIYGLKEQGYYPGTAKDVIKKILKEKGPMHSNELIETIAQQRYLKTNTILLNLQNKKHFKKFPDGKYHLA